MKQYGWKPGRHPAVSAQKVGRWLESLPDRRPATIIEKARAKASPLHAYFWKIPDAEALKEYRLLLARLMLASLTVDVVIYERKKQRTIQARAIVRSSHDGDFDSIEVAMSDPGKRDFVLAQAMAALQAARSRYAHLSELAVVFSAIDSVSKKLKKRA